MGRWLTGTAACAPRSRASGRWRMPTRCSRCTTSMSLRFRRATRNFHTAPFLGRDSTLSPRRQVWRFPRARATRLRTTCPAGRSFRRFASRSSCSGRVTGRSPSSRTPTLTSSSRQSAQSGCRSSTSSRQSIPARSSQRPVTGSASASSAGARGLHVHVAGSLFHDIEPAAGLGVPAVWINRHGETSDCPPLAELPDLGGLPALLAGLAGGG